MPPGLPPEQHELPDATLSDFLSFEGYDVMTADSGELRKRTFVVTRFDPDVDQAPKTQSYEVPCRPEWKVLDALNFIKDEIDPTLSHRWSCRMAVCGSCGMLINGMARLANASGGVLARVQTGSLHLYILLVLIGSFLALVWSWAHG